MNIDIYADGAKLTDIFELNKNPLISGFTTNPALMKKAGVSNYEYFIYDVLEIIGNKPVSFEVIADDFSEMYRQANKLASFGDNIYVKIPITNTKGESSEELIKELSEKDIKLNITAILTIEQIDIAVRSLQNKNNIISVFAGRVADTARPIDWLMRYAVQTKKKNQKILWASTRQAYNIVEAEIWGVDIITVTPDILKKIPMFGMSLEQLSLDTVKMFFNDAIESGLTL